MYFGTTPFSAAAFSDVGFSPDAFVNVQSVRLNLSIGNINVTAPVDLQVTGNRFNISTNDTTVVAHALTVLTGNALELDTGTAVARDLEMYQ